MQGADAKLQADGSKDDRDGGWNCFHQAASGGGVDAMKLLLSKEKELLHMRNSKAFTAFDVAADAGSLAAVRFLVEAHNVPSWDSHPTFGCNGFQLACRRGKLQVAEYLLSIENVPGVWMWRSKLERVQCMDSKGKTALHYAAEEGHVQTCGWLATKGAGTGIKRGESRLCCCSHRHSCSRAQSPWRATMRG
jgi:ankyrin repeat protein